MKTKLGAQRLLFPLPTVLIVTGNMEKANIMTLAWISILSGKPPTIGVSIGTRGISSFLIQENKDFSVNIVSAMNMIEADFCGITSGEDTDKFKETGLTKYPASKIKSPLIQECPINMECVLTDHKIIGTTNHFIAEIVETHIDSDKIQDHEKINSMNIEAINPLIYISGKQEYYSLGKKIGDAYKVGSKLFKNRL